MEIFEYLTGKGGFLILALITVIAVLYRKYRDWKSFKRVEKRRNNKK